MQQSKTNQTYFSSHSVPTANIGTVLMVMTLLLLMGATNAVSSREAAYTVNHAQLRPAQQSNGGMPTAVTYQGCLMDKAGQAVNGSLNLTLRLYAQPAGGTALWTERHTDVKVTDCQFNLTAGSLTPIPATVWATDPLYIGMTINNEAEMTPREALYPVRVPKSQMIQSGRVLGNRGSPNWSLHEGTGRRKHLIQVKFPKPFETVPTVQAQLSTLDARSQDRGIRIDVKAKNISRTGFDFVVSTWIDSVVYGFEGTWVAHD